MLIVNGLGVFVELISRCFIIFEGDVVDGVGDGLGGGLTSGTGAKMIVE